MSKAPLTRRQLVMVLVFALAAIAWLLWNRARRDRIAAEFEAHQPAGASASVGAATPGASGPAVHLAIQPIAHAPAGRPMYWVRVGTSAWELSPPGAAADESERDGWTSRNAEYWKEIRAVLREARTARGTAEPARGTIRLAAGDDPTVPHVLVMKLLDLFLEAGIEDVTFEGVSPPVPDGGPDGGD